MSPGKPVLGSTEILTEILILSKLALRAKKAENLLNGRRITKNLIVEADSLAAAEAWPLSDNQEAALYRQEMIDILFIETIQEVLAHWE